MIEVKTSEKIKSKNERPKSLPPQSALSTQETEIYVPSVFEGAIENHDQRARETLDLAMEVLFPYTDFHKAPFDLFLKFTDGKLTFEEEQMLNALGVKF